MNNLILLPSKRENASINSIFKSIKLSPIYNIDIDLKLNELVLNKNYNVTKTNEYFEYQHLYELSDEEIKVGDWVIAKCNDIEILPFEILKVSHIFRSGDLTDGSYHFKDTAKKIIRTTDTSLKLPLFSISELESFILNYNKDLLI
jgi:hypothetical protein